MSEQVGLPDLPSLMGKEGGQEERECRTQGDLTAGGLQRLKAHLYPGQA